MPTQPLLAINKGKCMRLFRLMGYVISIAAATFLITTGAAFAATPGLTHEASGGTLATVQKNAVLRVGVALNAPWVLRDKDGQWIGLEIDFVRQLAKDMRWKLELVPTTWAGAIGDLRDGRFDVLASGLSVTPQRTLQLKYSQSYGDYPLGLVVNRKSLGTDDLLALEKGGEHRIGVLAGTVTQATAATWLGNSELVDINDESQALKDVRSGKLDGLIAEQPLPQATASAYTDQLRTIDVSKFGKTAHAFAVRRNDQDLLDVVNAWLIYEKASGFIADREDFWLHSAAWVELM
jgi:polar amino acid transport system substrate-binding protein